MCGQPIHQTMSANTVAQYIEAESQQAPAVVHLQEDMNGFSNVNKDQTVEKLLTAIAGFF